MAENRATDTYDDVVEERATDTYDDVVEERASDTYNDVVADPASDIYAVSSDDSASDDPDADGGDFVGYRPDINHACKNWLLRFRDLDAWEEMVDTVRSIDGDGDDFVGRGRAEVFVPADGGDGIAADFARRFLFTDSPGLGSSHLLRESILINSGSRVLTYAGTYRLKLCVPVWHCACRILCAFASSHGKRVI